MIADFNMLIQAFKELNLLDDDTEQTFMQLTGYPHLENVCSNVLAFFFDTEETHGFNSLFIRSLLDCIGTDTDCRSTENIEREMRTDNGNRIDIFIETDKYLIAIENKVYSIVNNPLTDYETHIHKLNQTNGKEPIFILLTLKEESVGGSAFKNVTYAKFCSAIRKNLGTYIVNADTKWIVILNDFIRTIEELQEDNMLDKEFIEFYNENEEAIDALLKAKKNLPKSLKVKIQAIASMVSIDEHMETELVVNQNDCFVEYYQINKELERFGAPLVCEIYIDTKSCEIIVGIDDATSKQRKLLESFLTSKNLEYSPWDGNEDYLLVKKLDMFESEEVIASEFQNILNILA